jgi:hypothetical protein
MLTAIVPSVRVTATQISRALNVDPYLPSCSREISAANATTKNLLRYHGVLAPNARDRAEIVPAARAAGDDGGEPPKAVVAPVPPEARTGRYLLWHELLRRVFEIDVLCCPRCGGRLRLLCTVHDGFSARRYLQGVSAQSPPAEARPPPGPEDTTSA